MNDSCPPKPKRRWYQFSLRTLMLLVLVCAIFCSLSVTKLLPARRQRLAVAEIQKCGGRVTYSFSSTEPWQAKLFGNDFYAVVEVDLHYTKVTDADLVHLEGLTDLKRLDLDNTRVTDAGLVHLMGLTELEHVFFGETEVTGAGANALKKALPKLIITPSPARLAAFAEIKKLGGYFDREQRRVANLYGGPVAATDASLQRLAALDELEHLSLDGSGVSGAGLQHVKGATGLKTLSLARTRLTDVGLKHIQQLTELQELNVSQTRITDAGLAHLKGLPNLQSLDLNYTQVTDAGMEHLKGLTNLRELCIFSTKVTDAGLVHLEGLNNLRELALYDTQVTDEGGKKLRQALPDCKVYCQTGGYLVL